MFIPFGRLKNRQEEVNIAMLCPHLAWGAFKNPAWYHIPLYVIPPRMYGLVSAQYFKEDAEDILELWTKHPSQTMVFGDEPRPLSIQRLIFHRRKKLKNELKVVRFLVLNMNFVCFF